MYLRLARRRCACGAHLPSEHCLFHRTVATGRPDGSKCFYEELNCWSDRPRRPRTTSMRRRCRGRMPSVAMAFVNQIPNPLTGRQLDEPLLGELDQATDGFAAAVPVSLANIGQAGQLLLDDSLQLGSEFNHHTLDGSASGLTCNLEPICYPSTHGLCVRSLS
jgi:hypothetical protein